MRKAMPTMTASAVALQQCVPRESDAKTRRRLPALYPAVRTPVRYRQDIATLLGSVATA